MERIGEVHAASEPINSTRNSRGILDFYILGSQDVFHCGDDRCPGLSITASQNPLELDNHGLRHKDRLVCCCPPRGSRLLCVVPDEEPGQNVSIDRAHAAA